MAWVLAALLPVQLLDEKPGKAAEDLTKTWIPAPIMEIWMGFLAPDSSWPQFQSHCGNWGVNQLEKDLSFSPADLQMIEWMNK